MAGNAPGFHPRADSEAFRFEQLTVVVRSFIDAFGAAVDNGDPISGTDAVDWIVQHLPEFRAAVAPFRPADTVR